MSSPYAEELHIACTAVQQAAYLTRRLLRTHNTGAIEKGDLSPVTVGDFAVQALLTSALHSAFPDDHFIGEEAAGALRQNSLLKERVWELLQDGGKKFGEDGSRTLPQSQEEMCDLIDLGGKGSGVGHKRVWVFDPIDGTATYIKGEQYAINLALIEDGKQRIGVIGCPNLPANTEPIEGGLQDATIDPKGEEGGCMIHAVKGQGAYIRPLTPEAKKLLPASKLPRYADNVTSIKDVTFTECTTTKSTILPLHKVFASRLRLAHRWPGSDLWSSLMKYTSLTLGHANTNVRLFVYRYYKSNIWDHAGGILLYEEVGGKVTDLDGREIDVSRGRKLSENFGLVCAPEKIHGEVLRAVQGIMMQEGIAVESGERAHGDEEAPTKT